MQRPLEGSGKVVENLSGVSRATRGGLWLYLDVVLTCFVGYLYWLIISSTAGPSATGLAAATVSLAALIGQISFLGIPTGVQRFLGECAGSGDAINLGVYLGSSIIIILLVSFVGVSLILYLIVKMLSQIKPVFVLIAGSLVILSGLKQVLYSFYTSTLKTHFIAMTSVISGAFRFIVGISLVYLGWGGVGASLGYLTAVTMAVVMLSLLLLHNFHDVKFGVSLKAMMDMLKAGLASWPGAALSALGMWTGVLVVFGVHGAVETGLYYVALAIASVVIALPQSLLSTMFPLLSGMNDGRKRAAWRATKIAIAASTPLAAILVAYSAVVLGLMGADYVEASLELALLALSAAPIALFMGVWSLTYAYGRYSFILALSIAQTAPRVFLAFMLADMGGIGAAIGFLTGSLVGAALAVLVAKKIGLEIFWKELAILVGTPLAAAYLVGLLRAPWFLGAPAIIVVSVVCFLKLKAISQEDLKDAVLALVPNGSSIEAKALGLLRMLYGE